jgi:hypothetical protein
LTKLPMAKLDTWCEYPCEDECCKKGGICDTKEQAVEILNTAGTWFPLCRDEVKLKFHGMIKPEDIYLPSTIATDKPWTKVVKGMCVFYNKGCVLRHTEEILELERNSIQPTECMRFPLKLKKDEKRIFKWVPCVNERDIDFNSGIGNPLNVGQEEKAYGK